MKCQHDHEALKRYAALWQSLPLLGRMHTPAEIIDGVQLPAETIEMRNCTCGSTLAIEVP